VDAHILEDAGCYALVLEAIPDRVAALISQRLSIPTIGIGAGAGTDGQVLVTHDLLGLFDRFTPKFVKQYAALHAEMARAFGEYLEDVKNQQFPAPEHATPMDDEAYQALVAALEADVAWRVDRKAWTVERKP
jgi:3-methyl-2-oxobutanoate hydroxymethyltransferase